MKLRTSPQPFEPSFHARTGLGKVLATLQLSSISLGPLVAVKVDLAHAIGSGVILADGLDVRRSAVEPGFTEHQAAIGAAALGLADGGVDPGWRVDGSRGAAVRIVEGVSAAAGDGVRREGGPFAVERVVDGDGDGEAE